MDRGEMLKGLISKLLVMSFLTGLTIVAYGACFKGWFLPAELQKPVSLREGSQGPRAAGRGFYFLGGRSHYGGGYRGGK
jgi:hypothetical protein